jgi:hypothetical protein
MGLSRRAVALTAVLLVSAIGYIVFVTLFGLEPNAGTRNFGQTPGGPEQRVLNVYAEVLAIDPVNDSMRVRVSITPSRAMQGRHIGTTNRALRVMIGDGTTDHEVTVEAEDAPATQLIDADLNDGVISLYPFDRYSAKLSVDAYEIGPDAQQTRLPVALTVWEGISGWTVRSAEETAAAPGGVSLRFALRRPVAVTFMVSALYGVMAMIALASLTVGGGVFLRLRKLEATLGGVLATMLFSLPVMRYGLPGSPPIGVRADLVIYLWAQISAGLGLALFIATWARGDARPT